MLARLLDAFWYCVQYVLRLLFKQNIPTSISTPCSKRPLGRIAIIGAGVTGISSAAHCISNGFELVIFETRSSIGGVWSQVTASSGLQIHSMLYRFHPSVRWRSAYPQRDEILSEIRKVWVEYDLERRTRFNTPVLSVTRIHSEFTATPGSTRWLVNGVEGEIFDAVIVAVGTCGSPRREILPHADQFAGTVVHSSELDGEALRGKNVVVVGGGSSGIEAVETAVSHGARDVHIVSREDRWIIPRNIVFDTLISLQRSTRGPISYLFELVVAIVHYRGAQDVLPSKKTIVVSTPVVNNSFIKSLRHGRARLIRGKAAAFTERGVLLDAEVPEVDEEHSVSYRQEIEADAVVIAVGYSRPSLQFLQADLFPTKYTCPNLFLQTFCTEDWSLLLTNTSYVDGIGTVGHFHIGIYTRLLLAFLRDPSIRPTRGEMKLWVNRAGGLEFITYMDMMLWLVRFHLTGTRRLRWILFTFTGWRCSRV